ncbi:MAG TPA: hypothetical protein PK490_17585 [Prosthecobacter sp.]|mgnify:CR=1 FL=1|nr:hypothetical protein [Prosthecobacter sp.]HRK16101.1 hypothetical protein [Prosthecobacter sp.]
MKKTESLVVLALLLALLLLECGARMFETSLSKDVAHIRSLPAEAARLRQAPAGTLKVLILGNSLARCGLDRALLARGLEAASRRPVAVSVMHPDGSRVEEWRHGYRRYFDQTGSRPDLVLLCTGRLHLEDGLRDLDSVAAFYTSWADLPAFVRSEGLGFGDTCQAAAARASALFAHRRRVQPLVFYNFMPGYEQTVNLVQKTRNASAPTTRASPSCSNLASLATTIGASGGTLLILPVPLPESYELPALVKQTAVNAGARVLHASPALPPSRFPDGYHLDEEGARIWTQALLDSPEWKAALAGMAAK